MSETRKENEEMEISISELIESVLSRIWIVILAFFITVAFAVFYLLRAVPIYETSASMMVQPISKSSSLSSMLSLSLGSSNSINTEIELLSSRTTFDNALNKLDLTQYVNSEGIRYSDFEDPLNYESLKESVSFEPVDNTSFVKITVKDQNPYFASDFCNAIALAYSELLTGLARNSAQNQLDFVASQIPMVEQLLAESTQALSDFQKDNGVMRLTEQNEVLLMKLSYYSLIRTPLEYEIEEADKILSSIKADQALYQAISENGEIAGLKQDISNYYVELLSFDVIAASSNRQSQVLSAGQQARYYSVSQMQETAKTAMERIVEELASPYMSAVDARSFASAYVQKAVAEVSVAVLDNEEVLLDEELMKMPDMQRRLLELQGDVEINQQLLLKLREMESETALLRASIIDNVTSIDSALVPEDPVSPQKAKTLLIAGFLGIFAGVGIAVVLGLTDKRIKDREDLAKAIGDNIPILGWIPLEVKKNKAGKDGRVGLALYRNPMSFMSERYKHVASSMIYGKKLESRYITVCSPGKTDGKTTTVANIAYALALNGKKVLVVDLDLRKPNVENVFEVKHSKKGLVDVLNGDVDVSEAIRVPYENLPSLHILGTGSNVIVPSIVIQAQPLNLFLGKVSNLYDYIFFDAPPLSFASELLTIACIAPEVLIVARAGISNIPEVELLIEELRSGSANIIGACLNGLALDSTSFGMKSRYGYKYGYGSYNLGAREDKIIRKTYLRKASKYSVIYKRQLKSRLQEKDTSMWPDAPLAYPDGIDHEKHQEKKADTKIVKAVMPSDFDAFLKEIENDEEARGKKE